LIAAAFRIDNCECVYDRTVASITEGAYTEAHAFDGVRSRVIFYNYTCCNGGADLECKEKARSMEYTIYPHPTPFSKGTPVQVKNYAYFRAVDSGSHFGLGCSLDDAHRIMFLGIFYALKSSNFAIANTLPIYRAVSGNGNVLLKGTAANQFIEFEFVRGFSTDSIRPARVGEGIKNCESTELPDGGTRIHQSAFTGDVFIASETREEDGDITVKACSDASHKSCQSAEYQSLFSGDDPRIIHKGLLSFVTASGDLLVQKDYRKRDCPSDPNLLHSDLCTMLEKR